MGLDATVYCDCLERGTLRTPPRPQWRVYVAADGSRGTRATELAEQLAFDQWSSDKACDHPNGILAQHWQRDRLRALEAALRELVDAALTVRKPIAF